MGWFVTGLGVITLGVILGHPRRRLQQGAEALLATLVSRPLVQIQTSDTWSLLAF